MGRLFALVEAAQRKLAAVKLSCLARNGLQPRGRKSGRGRRGSGRPSRPIDAKALAGDQWDGFAHRIQIDDRIRSYIRS